LDASNHLIDPETSKTSTVASSSRWVRPSICGGSFAPMPHSPRCHFEPGVILDPTRITRQALAQNIASPPRAASGIFRAVLPSPQCGSDFAICRRQDPQAADGKAILVRLAGGSEKLPGVAREAARNRASVSTIEQIFAFRMLDARRCKTCGPRATMVRESASKVVKSTEPRHPLVTTRVPELGVVAHGGKSARGSS
jgi:hypothetical protein